MPLPLLLEYIKNLPRIRAIRSAHMSEAFAVGGGNLEKKEMSRITREWRHLIRGSSKEAPLPMNPAFLAQMGIAIEFVPPE